MQRSLFFHCILILLDLKDLSRFDPSAGLEKYYYDYSIYIYIYNAFKALFASV